MCPFCFGSVLLVAGSVVSVVSSGGFAAVAVKRFAERLERSKSTKSRGEGDARQRSAKQNN